MRLRDEIPSAAATAAAVLEALEQRQFLSLIGVVPTYPVVSYDSTGVLAYHAATEELDISATPLTFKQSASSSVLSIIDSVDDLQLHLLVDNSGNLIGGVPGAANDLSVSGTVVHGNGTVVYSGVLLTGRMNCSATSTPERLPASTTSSLP